MGAKIDTFDPQGPSRSLQIPRAVVIVVAVIIVRILQLCDAFFQHDAVKPLSFVMSRK